MISIKKKLMVSDRAGLTELDIGDVELLDEEPGPSNKRLQKSKHLHQRQERCEWLDARVVEADFDADDFWYVIYLLLL
jgi:hypothetical protein